jgi:hypothetical protein
MLQSTLRELRILLLNPRLWAVFAVVVGLFVLTGPFGTYERLALPTRLGYWLILHATTWITALVFVALFDVALAPRIANRLGRMLLGAVIASVPIGLAITLINWAIRETPFDAATIGDNILIAAPIALAFCLLTWLSLSAAPAPAGSGQGSGISDPQIVSQRSGRDEIATPFPNGAESAPQPAPRAALIDRLPVEKRGAILRLEVQDHYVLVVTVRASDLLLMRLGDAIAETAPDSGVRVHRSHWVADEAVERIVRRGGSNPRLEITTVDGATIPVSRSFTSDVRSRWGDRISKPQP